MPFVSLQKKKKITLQTASLFAVPTKYGWCVQNKTRIDALGAAGRAADDITSKAFTKTSTEGRNGTWESNELSDSLHTCKINTPQTGKRENDNDMQRLKPQCINQDTCITTNNHTW